MAEHQDLVHFSLSKPDSLEQNYEQQTSYNNNNNTDLEECANVSPNRQTSWRQKTRSPKKRSPHTGFKIDPHYVLAHVRSQRSSPEMKTANKIPSHYEWDNNLTPKYDIPSENPTKIHAVHQKIKKQDSGKSTKKSPKRRTGRFRLMSKKSSRSASAYQGKHGVAIGNKQTSLHNKVNVLSPPPPTPTDTIEVPRRRTSRIIYDAFASVLSPFTPSPVTPLAGNTQPQTGRPNPGPLTVSGKDVITRTLDDEGEEQKQDDAEEEAKEEGALASRLSRVDAFHESSKTQGTPLNSARSDGGPGSIKGTPPAKPPKRTTPAKLPINLQVSADKIPDVYEETPPNSYRISDRNTCIKTISGNLVSPLTLETTAIYTTSTDTLVYQSNSESENLTSSAVYESIPTNSCRVSDILREISMKKAAAESPSISPRPAFTTPPTVAPIIDSDSEPTKTDGAIATTSANIVPTSLKQNPAVTTQVIPISKALVEEDDDGSDVYEDCDDDEEASIARSTASSNVEPSAALPVSTALPLEHKPPQFDAIVINSPCPDTQDTPLSSARSEAGRSTKGTPPPKPARKPSLVKVTEPALMSAEPPPPTSIHKSTGSTSNTWHISDISLLHLTSFTTEPDAASDTGSDATAASHPATSTASDVDIALSPDVPANPPSDIPALPVNTASTNYKIVETSSTVYTSMAYEPTPPNTCRISDIMRDISIRKATSSTDLVSFPPPYPFESAPTAVIAPSPSSHENASTTDTIPTPPIEVVSDAHSEPTERDMLLKDTMQGNKSGNLLADTWKDVYSTDKDEVQHSSDDEDVYEDCIDGEESSIARSSTTHFEPSPCAVNDVDSFSPPSAPPSVPPTDLKPLHFDVHVINNSSTTIQDTVMSSARSEDSSARSSEAGRSTKGTPPPKPARKSSLTNLSEKLQSSTEKSPATSKPSVSSLNTWHISDIYLLHLTSYTTASDGASDTGSDATASKPAAANTSKVATGSNAAVNAVPYPLVVADPPAVSVPSTENGVALSKHILSDMPALPIIKTCHDLGANEAPLSPFVYDCMAYESTPPNTCRISDIMRDLAKKRAAAEAAAESTAQDT